MTCAIKRAAGEDPPPGRGKPRQRELNTKERRQLEADRNSLTKHFIAELPELLSKFSTDEQKIVSLVEIPQYFHVSQISHYFHVSQIPQYFHVSQIPQYFHVSQIPQFST